MAGFRRRSKANGLGRLENKDQGPGRDRPQEYASSREVQSAELGRGALTMRRQHRCVTPGRESVRQCALVCVMRAYAKNKGQQENVSQSGTCAGTCRIRSVTCPFANIRLRPLNTVGSRPEGGPTRREPQGHSWSIMSSANAKAGPSGANGAALLSTSQSKARQPTTPRDARIIALMLASMGVESAQEGVVRMLMEFAHRTSSFAALHEARSAH